MEKRTETMRKRFCLRTMPGQRKKIRMRLAGSKGEKESQDEKGGAKKNRTDDPKTEKKALPNYRP